jgi:hypothetical protein
MNLTFVIIIQEKHLQWKIKLLDKHKEEYKDIITPGTMANSRRPRGHYYPSEGVTHPENAGIVERREQKCTSEN